MPCKAASEEESLRERCGANSSIIFLKPQDRRSAARAVLSRPDLQELFPFLEAPCIGKCEMMKVWNDTTCAKVRSFNLRLDFAWETLMVFLICLCCIQAMPDLEASDSR